MSASSPVIKIGLDSTRVEVPTNAGRTLVFTAKERVPVIEVGYHGTKVVGLETPPISVGINGDPNFGVGEVVDKLAILYDNAVPDAATALEKALVSLDGSVSPSCRTAVLLHAAAADATRGYADTHVGKIARILGIDLEALECAAIVPPDEEIGWLTYSVVEQHA